MRGISIPDAKGHRDSLLAWHSIPYRLMDIWNVCLQSWPQKTPSGGGISWPYVLSSDLYPHLPAPGGTSTVNPVQSHPIGTLISPSCSCSAASWWSGCAWGDWGSCGTLCSQELKLRCCVKTPMVSLGWWAGHAQKKNQWDGSEFLAWLWYNHLWSYPPQWSKRCGFVPCETMVSAWYLVSKGEGWISSSCWPVRIALNPHLNHHEITIFGWWTMNIILLVVSYPIMSHPFPSDTVNSPFSSLRDHHCCW